MDVEFYKPEEKIFGQTIVPYQEGYNEKHVVLSGFPYDEGTRINGGRIGGSAASLMFRKALQVHEVYAKNEIVVMDSGDIDKELALPQAHEQLFKKNHKLLQNLHSTLFVIGGSNDQSYPNVRSLMELYPTSKIAVINIDAHFDVRPLKEGLAHSGSPFRLMLENPLFKQNNSIFIEFASKGASCSNEHLKYLKQGTRVIWLERDIRRLKPTEGPYRTQAGQMMNALIEQLEQEVDSIFFSFDIDSVSAVSMPGVSAPSVVGGLTDEQANELMIIAGKSKKIRLVDCSEFNPAVEYQKSSRFLAELFYTFCMAVATR